MLTHEIWNSFIDPWWNQSLALSLSLSLSPVPLSLSLFFIIFSLSNFYFLSSFSHKTTFCSLPFIFFTDRGIPAHFLTHARILKTEAEPTPQTHTSPPLSLSLSLYLSSYMDMIRAAAEHRETSENRRGQGREPRFFSSQIIPYYFAFPSLPHHSSNPYETPYNTLPQPHHPDSPPPTTTTTFPTILSLPPPPWSLSLLWFFWLFSVWVFMETWEASEFLG